MLRMEKSKRLNLECIILENEQLSVTVIPALGGKIASVMHLATGFELVCQTSKPAYRIPACGDFYEDFDLSGWDDTFPTIDEDQVTINGERIVYPDHGELWSAPFDAQMLHEVLYLSCHSQILPYRYDKEIWLEGEMLRCRSTVHHTGTTEFPCLWTFHGLVRYEPDMELIYPRGIEAFENVMDSPQLGKTGARFSVGQEHMKSGGYDFLHVPPPESRTMLKYYAADPVKEGICGFRYPSQGMECILHYDREQLPYLGFWLTAGGLNGKYHCAMEPSNGYYDKISIAADRGRLPVLKPGEQIKIDLSISLTNIK